MSGRVVTLHAIVSQEGDWYVARCLEIDAVDQGATEAEALANLRTMVELYLAHDPELMQAEPVPLKVHVPA
jgi:predicted RNase H-like HicB family nuclease